MKTWRPPAGQDAQILSGKSPKAISKAMKHGPHSKNPGTSYLPMPGMAGISNPITGNPAVQKPISIPFTGKPISPISIPFTGKPITIKK